MFTPTRRPSRGRAVLCPDPRVVPMHVTRERLLAAVRHLHGPPRVQGEQRRVDLDGEILPPAERATDAGEVDTNLLGPEPQAGNDLLVVDVQPLGGDVDVDAALAVGDGQAGLGTEKRLILARQLVDAADRDGASASGSPRRMTIERTTFGRGSSRWP